MGTNENARGLKPELWGPPVWQAFHYTAAGFPSHPSQSERENYRQYFSKFPFVLPCEECKHHAIALMARMPPVVDSRDRMFEWTVKFHNAVSERIGISLLDLSQARTRYGLPELPENTRGLGSGPATTPPPVVPQPRALATATQPQARSAPAVVRQSVTAIRQPQTQRIMGYNPSGLSQSSTRAMYRAPNQHQIRQPQSAPRANSGAVQTRGMPIMNTSAPKPKRRCNCGGK